MLGLERTPPALTKTLALTRAAYTNHSNLHRRRRRHVSEANLPETRTKHLGSYINLVVSANHDADSALSARTSRSSHPPAPPPPVDESAPDNELCRDEYHMSRHRTTAPCPAPRAGSSPTMTDFPPATDLAPGRQTDDVSIGQSRRGSSDNSKDIREAKSALITLLV